MKTINKIFMSLGVAATAFGLSSCVGDLDLEPNNPNEITNVSDDMDRVFADLYLNFSTFGPNGDTPVKDFDGGMASFTRAMSIAEEYPTDECAWLWDPASYGTINYGMVNPALDCVFGFYSRLMVNISLCNHFISSVNNGEFNLDEAGKERSLEYIRQARVLRGACYYYMLSFYDKIPYSDENTPVGAEPEQKPRAEVYRIVTTELEQVVADYNDASKGAKYATPYYGFVGVDVAEAILMKIYLNGKVFAGQDNYTECYRHAKNIIDRLGKGGLNNTGLAPNYQALFGSNNERYVLGNAGSNCNEIIWGLVQDDPHLLSWQGSTYQLSAWIGTNGVEVTMPVPTMTKYVNDKGELDLDKYHETNEKYFEKQEDFDKAKEEYDKAKASEDTKWKTEITEEINNTYYSFDPKAAFYIAAQWYNAADSWKCLVARSAFVNKFEWNDTDKSVSDDMRTKLWVTSARGFASSNPTLVGDNWGENGYLTPKYSNWAYKENGEIDYVNSLEPKAQLAGDYAVIRLAEVYLSAAEAILAGSQEGTNAEALRYVNYIRERAYGDKYTPWTSLTMEQLRDERCRELYFENVRRTDLIRWDLWCTGYTWDWKGGVRTGTNLPEYTKLYPIPSRVLTSSKFEQTTGY